MNSHDARLTTSLDARFSDGIVNARMGDTAAVTARRYLVYRDEVSIRILMKEKVYCGRTSIVILRNGLGEQSGNMTKVFR